MNSYLRGGCARSRLLECGWIEPVYGRGANKTLRVLRSNSVVLAPLRQETCDPAGVADSGYAVGLSCARLMRVAQCAIPVRTAMKQALTIDFVSDIACPWCAIGLA